VKEHHPSRQSKQLLDALIPRGRCGRTRAEIQARLDEIEADERFHYPPANVLVNAPLALIQVELKAQHEVLTWLLNTDGEFAAPQNDA